MGALKDIFCPKVLHQHDAGRNCEKDEHGNVLRGVSYGIGEEHGNMQIQRINAVSGKGGEVGADEQLLTFFIVTADHEPCNQADDALTEHSVEQKDQDAIEGIIALLELQDFNQRKR